MQYLREKIYLLHCMSQVLFRYIRPNRRVPVFAHTGPWSLDSQRQWESFAKAEIPKLLAPEGERVPDFAVSELPTNEQIFKIAQAAWQHLEEVANAGATVITYGDILYPALLYTMTDPPLALTVQGDLEAMSRKSFAVVGSRKPSPHASQESFRLGFAIANAGHTVISGGAFGCDASAHRGALAAQNQTGKTVVVIAGGNANPHPHAHRKLFRDILDQGGAIVSERLWWAESRPFDFPIRNRIISGLSTKVFLMQAAQRSGALITARMALDMGRDVIVLEHPRDDVRAAGNHKLSEDGAETFPSTECLLRTSDAICY